MRRFQYAKKVHRVPWGLVALLLSAAVLLVFVYGLSSLSEDTSERQMQALEEAISHSITHCYAVEGAYPESLEYLKEHYGISFDENKFFVDYRAIGSNIRPDVTIIEKGAMS